MEILKPNVLSTPKRVISMNFSTLHGAIYDLSLRLSKDGLMDFKEFARVTLCEVLHPARLTL